MGKDVNFKIPQPFNIGLQGGVDVGLDLEGLDDIGVTLEGGNNKIGIDLGLDNIDAKIDAGLDNIKADFGLDNINACLSFGIKELPKMRVHLPNKYEFGIKILGINLFSFFINGKSMLVTEDNPVRVFHKPMQKASHSRWSDAVPTVKISPQGK